MPIENALSQRPAAVASTAPPAPGEADFEAIYAAVMATERGRWFLCEYARRNRQTDTVAVLAAIDRLIVASREDAELKALTPPEPKPVAETGADMERLRAELADMASAIARTKVEIASIKPDAANSDPHHGDRILEATEQLDSVVRTTERATSDILAAAEQVQEVAWTMREQGMEPEFCDQLDGYATAIYTACSFQDLTGQRTRKIIHVLRYLEARIHVLNGLWGAASTASPAPTGQAVPTDDLVQNDVDLMMAPTAPIWLTETAEPLERSEEMPPAMETLGRLDEVPAATEAPPSSEHLDRLEGAPRSVEPSVPSESSVVEPAAAAPAIEGPKGSFSLLPEPAEESRRPRVMPPVAEEPYREPMPEPADELNFVISDLLVFASDFAAEFHKNVATPAGAEPTPVPTTTACEPVREPPSQPETILPLAAAPRLADMTQDPAQHRAPVAPAAAPRRASDLAEDLFADVMALTEEERIALFT